ncbi:cysteine proteinase inhibitor B-like [Ipomoea triloba]|uniref:cysteine proteinase inhibitor B-like n=1 Tax=Ipomoea triloba TaxID=35885 RepID=UPI00125D9181|nr:cysteine proteinase inhibitor B-like [Ipomoea triloba]
MAAKTRVKKELRVVSLWAVVIMVCSLISSMTTQVEALGRRGVVGGRTEIEGVKSNQEVQDLGKYCVDQYNVNINNVNNGHGDLMLRFSEVLEAERQVVSGIKYYLKISAVAVSTGLPHTFDAQVVVKPWLHSKHLLSFAPSSSSSSSPPSFHASLYYGLSQLASSNFVM